MMPALGNLMTYLRSLFEQRRREPRDDLISALVGRQENGEELSDDELLSTCFLLFVAGHETTTHLISGGVLALLQHPQQLERLKGDWSLLPSAVDELLRYVSPVQFSKPRFAKEDTQLAGVPIARGEQHVALLASANFDPDVFDAPETLDLARQGNRPIAFGQGPHLCLGLHLARTEMQAVLKGLFTRHPDLDLAVPQDDLRWAKMPGFRALRALPLKLAA